MAVLKPTPDDLKVQIGKNELLQETPSEKFGNIGRGIYGLGIGIESFADASKIGAMLKRLQPASESLARHLGVSVPEAAEMLLLGKVTPQGLEQVNETRFRRQGDVNLGRRFAPVVLDATTQANKIAETGNPDNFLGIQTQSQAIGSEIPIQEPSGSAGGIPIQEPKTEPLNLISQDPVPVQDTLTGGINFDDLSDEEAAQLSKNLSSVGSFINARTSQGEKGVNTAKKSATFSFDVQKAQDEAKLKGLKAQKEEELYKGGIVDKTLRLKESQIKKNERAPLGKANKTVDLLLELGVNGIKPKLKLPNGDEVQVLSRDELLKFADALRSGEDVSVLREKYKQLVNKRVGNVTTEEEDEESF